ncbi:MAG: ribonuclease III domain-containing protein [Candidatus Thorarchaeota archaeon]
MSLGESVLEWHQIDLKKHLHHLIQIIQQDLDTTQANKTRTIDKMKKWIKQLNYIIERVHDIQQNLTPKIERIFGVSFDKPELFTISLFQPSTKNTFLELQAHYCKGNDDRIDCDAMPELISLSAVGEMLALLGDAVFDMAVLHLVWKPRASDVGTLTQDRAEVVSNEHLSLKCDEWGLYENRIHFDPPTPSKSEMEHDKGTLVEALYGVLYVELGFERVRELVGHLL